MSPPRLAIALAIPALLAVLVPWVAESEAYVLYQMTGGERIKMETGKQGETVQLLKNPEFRRLGTGDKAVTIPLAPKDSIGQGVPDGYQTLVGVTIHLPSP